MSKIFMVITTIALTMGLIGFLFNLEDYSFMTQLGKIQALQFANPVEDLKVLIDKANALFNFASEDAAWYEYLALGIAWLGTILEFPIILIQDVATNTYNGLLVVLYAVGF